MTSTETSIQRFSYDADGRVIGVNYNGTYYYYLRNAQGDIVKLIDKTGSTVVEYTYDTWGKLLSTTGSLAATFGAEQPFRYRGYVYDEETGFYYLQSRYYNPEVGRFISADVYLSTGQGVLGHNSYAYCLNNPVNMLDSNGSFGLFTAILIGVLVGVVSNVIVNGVMNVTDGNDETDFFDGAGWAALEGGLSGALAASPAGIVIQVPANAAISFGCSVGSELTDDKQGISWKDVLIDTAGGFFAGLVGGNGVFHQGVRKATHLFDMERIVFKVTELVVRENAARSLKKAMMRSIAVTIGRASMDRIIFDMSKPNCRIEP